MIKVMEKARVYLYLEAVDMRKAINGFTALVHDELKLNPSTGDVFVFCSRHRKKVKVLFYDRNGFILYYKRLEDMKFMLPKHADSNHIELSQKELSWFLAGLDFMTLKKFTELNYSYY